MSKKIKFKNQMYNIQIKYYQNNNRLCLRLMDDYELEMNITVNLSSLPSNNNEYIYISDYCKLSGFEEVLIENGLIEKVGSINCNYEVLDLVKVDLIKIQEYDPEGYKEYLDAYTQTKDNFNEIVEKEKVLDILESDDCLTIVEDKDFVYIDKKSLPDYIVMRNKDIQVYDKDGNFLLSTLGFFLDKIDVNFRKEIIDNLLDLQFSNKNCKMVNFVTPYVADSIRYKLNVDKNKSMVM